METVVQPPADADLHILTQWGDAADAPRKRRAAVFSVLAHVVAVVTLFTLPKGLFVPPPQMAQVQITPLIEPLTEREEEVLRLVAMGIWTDIKIF